MKYPFITFLFLLLLCFSLVKTARASDPIREVLQLVNAGGLAPSNQGVSCQLEGQSLQRIAEDPCEELSKKYLIESSLRDKFFATSEGEEKNQLGLEMRAQEKLVEIAASACLRQRFSRCYLGLKQEISKDKLKKMFQSFTGDYRFRYATGGGACHLRAEALAYTLAKSGYAAKVVRIEHAPTLIAMDRALDNKLTGRYYDYHGYHTLIQIMVNDNGHQVPYLLDPQFMTEPMPRDEYFLKTTGQVCKSLDETEDKSFLNCYYKLLPQNEPTERANAHAILDPKNQYSACGWNEDPLHDAFAGRSQKPLPKVRGLELANSGPEDDTSSDVERMTVSERTHKILISRAYAGYRSRLLKRLKDTEAEMKNLELTSMFWGEEKKEIPERIKQSKRTKAQLEQDLLHLHEKIQEVEANLKK